MLFGGLGGQTIGVTAYAQVDAAWYVEAGAYRSLSAAFLRHVNGGYDGRLSGVAPYARVSYTWNLANGSVSIGGFLLDMKRGLVGENVAGDAVPLTGPTDRFRDIGANASYQYFRGDHTMTLHALYVREQQRLDASFADGDASRLRGRLQSLNLKGSYWYRNTYGVTLAAFANNGSSDIELYGNDGSPNTQGQMIEFDYNPFGQSASWRQPWANVRLGSQYTYFSRFSGRVYNVDGAGRKASDNNTLYLYLWLAI